MILRPKSSTSSARWRNVLIFERLELLIPPLQHAANDRFGGQQRRPQLALELARSKQIAQHLAMRAKNAGQRRIEFGLDPLGRIDRARPAFPQTTAARRPSSPSTSSCADRQRYDRSHFSTSPTTQACPMPKPGAMLRPESLASDCARLGVASTTSFPSRHSNIRVSG